MWAREASLPVDVSWLLGPHSLNPRATGRDYLTLTFGM